MLVGSQVQHHRGSPAEKVLTVSQRDWGTASLLQCPFMKINGMMQLHSISREEDSKESRDVRLLT